MPPFDYETAEKMFSYIFENINDLKSDQFGFMCDGTLKHTIQWLSEHFNYDIELIHDAVDFLQDHGGFCDCEVILNTTREEYWK